MAVSLNRRLTSLPNSETAIMSSRSRTANTAGIPSLNNATLRMTGKGMNWMEYMQTAHSTATTTSIHISVDNSTNCLMSHIVRHINSRELTIEAKITSPLLMGTSGINKRYRKYTRSAMPHLVIESFKCCFTTAIR